MTSTRLAAAAQLGYEYLPGLLELLRSDAKHDPSAASTLDVHWVLYDRVLNVTPDTADDPERDRLLLSKGHGPASYYAVLAAKGFISVDALASFGRFDSPLGHHPDGALIAGRRDRERLARARAADRRRSRAGAASGRSQRLRASSACWATASSPRAPTTRPSRSPGAWASTG